MPNKFEGAEPSSTTAEGGENKLTFDQQALKGHFDVSDGLGLELYSGGIGNERKSAEEIIAMARKAGLDQEIVTDPAVLSKLIQENAGSGREIARYQRSLEDGRLVGVVRGVKRSDMAGFAEQISLERGIRGEREEPLPPPGKGGF